ncbi:transcriptional regulator TbsP [Halomicrococcus gelatinilyticus]|uniref:transcriptional regulator TbsP n=1 Tax=Halomicrococcus gelatinilyticus TaxID=1702103 RepID=UPI0038996CE7
METKSNLLNQSVNEILRTVIDEAPEVLHVVNPSRDVIEQLIDAATAYEGDLPEIRMLANESILKDVMEDFIIASNAADLIDADALRMRTTEEPAGNELLITDDVVMALVTAGDSVGGLTSDDGEFVDAANDAYTTNWEEADEFSLRTPPLSRVRDTLREEISADAEDDFNSVLSSLETARGDGDGLDEVTISLLVAAKNEALLYDISKWGEDVGIASKATFSRTKTKLEDMGLIGTEKVPIDVGRPRLRLKLAHDELESADADQLAGVAQSILH